MKIGIETIKESLKDESTLIEVRQILNGGPGSGNFGHAGIPGQVGGSVAGGGGGGGSKRFSAGPGSETGHWDMQMSSDEQAAMEMYKGTGYKDVNSGLYDPPPSEFAKTVIEEMDSVIDRSVLDSDVTVYSGLGPTASQIFSGLDEGSEVNFAGYLSTSKKEGIAGTFSRGGARRMIVLDLPKGSNGFYMGDDNVEKEIVLPRGKKYKINKISKEKKFVKYHVSVVS